IFLLSIVLVKPVAGSATTHQAGQPAEIKGQVTDEKGTGLPGVSVQLKGRYTGVVTDRAGNFRIRVPDRLAVLRFSFVGYEQTEQTVGNRTEINVVLYEEKSALDEVVVVGYGTVNRRDLTGAVVSVSAEEIEKRVPV